MTAAPPAVRNLFRAALVIFVITVVIGILNGTDVWDPPRNTLLTHVHAGTLGWITLSVFGGAIWMLGRADDESSGPLAKYSIVALSLYVFAFWSADLFDTTETIQRPIGGTLAFIAIVWMFVWAIRQKRGTSWNVAEFGIGLALLFLVIGAILGILLGLQLADVEIVAAENADQLGGAHPAAMVIGYVVLASIAIIEWLLRGTATPGVRAAKAGVVQMSLLFLAGLFGMLGILLDVEPLLLLNVPFQVTGIIIVLWRLRHELAPSRWRGDFLGVYLRTAVFGLVLAVAQTANVVRLFVSGGEDEEALFEMIEPYILALDHTTFLLVVTNMVLAMMAMSAAVSDMANRVIYTGLNVGAAGFIVGLLAESSTLKRIFTPILGLALLYGIYTHLTAKQPEKVAAAM